MSAPIPYRMLWPALLMLASPAAPAEVSASLDYAYYAALADPQSSLSAILKRSAPPSRHGGGFLGWTDWHVSWHFKWHANANGECRITEVATTLTGTITLPRLENATAAQAKELDSVLPALRVHELGHYAIGRDTADAIDQGILSLPPMQDCDALGSAANQLGRRIIDEQRKVEDQYDLVTRHGKTQGAWLDR
jgi:predicted secreted Zn-dependent protease